MSSSAHSTQVFSELRYAPNWPDIAHNARARAKHKCCWCLVAKSAEVHHAMYVDSEGAIAGREKPGTHVFPLCKECHNELHTKARWITHPDFPIWLNRSTDDTILKLRIGWTMLTQSR